MHAFSCRFTLNFEWWPKLTKLALTNPNFAKSSYSSVNYIHRESVWVCALLESSVYPRPVALEWESPLLNYASILSSSATVNYEPGASLLPSSRSNCLNRFPGEMPLKVREITSGMDCTNGYFWQGGFTIMTSSNLLSDVPSCTFNDMHPPLEKSICTFQKMAAIHAITVSLCVFLDDRLRSRDTVKSL